MLCFRVCLLAASSLMSARASALLLDQFRSCWRSCLFRQLVQTRSGLWIFLPMPRQRPSAKHSTVGGGLKVDSEAVDMEWYRKHVPGSADCRLTPLVPVSSTSMHR